MIAVKIPVVPKRATPFPIAHPSAITAPSFRLVTVFIIPPSKMICGTVMTKAIKASKAPLRGFILSSSSSA
ncbi:Uncharacterised protein [Streptococcus pneumoniae]|nr:Uncharacterised protein [Streptococcus pneumoniae]